MSLPVVLALCQGPSRGPTGVSSPQWRALTYALIPRCRDQSVLLVNPCLGDKLLYGATDQLLESYVAPEEERVQPVQWVTATMEEHSKGVRLVVQHSKVGGGGGALWEPGWPGGCSPGWWVTPWRGKEQSHRWV